VSCSAIATTPRKGKHFVFKQPAGKRYRNTASKLAPNVDTRANGGYLIVAPSHANGGCYEWLEGCDLASLVEPPNWLVEQLDSMTKKRSANKRHRTSIEDRAARYLDKVPPAVSGSGGHNATFHAACVLVAGFNLSPDAAFPVLAAWNAKCEPPWTDEELWHKLNDADGLEDERGLLLNNPAPAAPADHNANGTQSTNVIPIDPETPVARKTPG